MTQSQRKKLQHDKTVKKGLATKTWGKAILAIPKHLLKLTIVVIIGSFLGMIYIL